MDESDRGEVSHQRPNGLIDGSNVYGYVQDRSLSKTDPLGWASCTPNWTGPCTLSNFRAWYLQEKPELNTWLPKLEPRPCTLACYVPGYVHWCWGNVARVDYKICPSAPKGFTYLTFQGFGGYHPGTVYELRENNCPDDCQPGNQCTYDANGNLLTTPPGAGSADRYSGGCGNNWAGTHSPNHVTGDKDPYDCAVQLDPNEALGLLDYYEEVRPTNGGQPCATGPFIK